MSPVWNIAIEYCKNIALEYCRMEEYCDEILYECCPIRRIIFFVIFITDLKKLKVCFRFQNMYTNCEFDH